MKRIVFMVLAVLVALPLAGCNKKQQALEELQEPMSMEALSKMPAEAPLVAEPKTAPQAAVEAPAVSVSAPVVSTSAEAKPTNQEIQTALKNAGLYLGEIDGKIGPQTRRAVEDFQKAHNLKVDGKVGPQTWAALSPYLNPPAAEVKSKKKR
jgi:murein L,D-transpeptidase YcbB/YkuD